MKQPTPSTALPPDAVAALIAASRVGAAFRAEAIDKATTAIMSRYPWAYTDAAIREARERADNTKFTGAEPNGEASGGM